MIPARDCRQHNSRHISLFTDKQTSRPWNTLKAEVGLLLLYGLAKALEMSVLVLVWTCCYTNHLGCPRFYHIFRNPGFNWNLQIVIFCSVKAISDFFFFYIKLHLKFWPSLESALLCLASHLPLLISQVVGIWLWTILFLYDPTIPPPSLSKQARGAWLNGSLSYCLMLLLQEVEKGCFICLSLFFCLIRQTFLFSGFLVTR